MEDNQNLQEQIIEFESPAKKSNKKIIILILVVLIILAAALVYFFVFRNGSVLDDQENLTGGKNQIGTSAARPGQSFSEGDKDGDGITNEKEQEIGTSDLEYDTDWDGISDKEEIEKWGTDPAKSDTDGDGYADGYEIIKGFNPKGTGRL